MNFLYVTVPSIGLFVADEDGNMRMLGYIPKKDIPAVSRILSIVDSMEFIEVNGVIDQIHMIDMPDNEYLDKSLVFIGDFDGENEYKVVILDRNPDMHNDYWNDENHPGSIHWIEKQYIKEWSSAAR